MLCWMRGYGTYRVRMPEKAIMICVNLITWTVLYFTGSFKKLRLAKRKHLRCIQHRRWASYT
jgi:hypothetical protein